MGTVDFQQDFEEIPVLKLVPEQRTSDPSTSVIGRLWARTDLSTLKIWLGAAKTLATTDDTRFTDSRTPSGAAGGDLSGTYPNPDIGANKVTLAKLALALLQNGVSSGTAAVGDLALRKLGFTTHDAMPGTARLDQIAAPTASVSLGSQKITGLLAGTASTDAVNKGQLDAAVQGLAPKDSVKYATTADFGGAVATPSLASAAVAATFDGAAIGDLPVGTRVLRKNEHTLVGSNQAYNGIYEVTSNNGSTVAFARAADMDAFSEVDGAFTFVEEGSTLASTGWVSDTASGGTLNTTGITWTQFSGAGQVVAGSGLSKTGNTLDVNVDNSSLEIAADVLRVKAAGITNAMLAGAIDLASKVTGLLALANGGTGASTAAGARTNLGVAGVYSGASPALTAGTWTDVVHNLGVAAKDVSFKIASTGEGTQVAWRDKAGSTTTTIQIKIDVVGGRVASYYTVNVSA